MRNLESKTKEQLTRAQFFELVVEVSILIFGVFFFISFGVCSCSCSLYFGILDGCLTSYILFLCIGNISNCKRF